MHTMNKQKTTTSSNINGDEQSNEISSSSNTRVIANSSNGTASAETSDHINIRPYDRMVQNFLVVWLDGSIDELNNDNYRNTIDKLRQAVNTIKTFTDVDRCIDFINNIKNEKVFVIYSDVLGPTTAALIHDIAQVSSMYIFCQDQAHHEQWAKDWRKVKGVFADITPICQALQQAAKECDQNSVSMSFVPPSNGGSTEKLDQLDSTFMYTQILKEILFATDFEQKHFTEFIVHCLKLLVGNTIGLENVDKLKNEYHLRNPISWCTYQSFLYPMLNRVLRTMEIDLIMKMSFFVRDLHEQIAKLHSEQYTGQRHSTPFTVYRGQGLSQIVFDQLKNTQGGLMCFNSFLSTSLDRAAALAFVESNQNNPDLIGVLFQITVDLSIPSTPFANTRDVDCYQDQEEILFSMHSVFRIGHIKQIDNNSRLWQVVLTLTGDNDPQLHALNERMRHEVEGSTGWHRLGQLMIKLGQFKQAEELFELLLDQTTDEGETGSIYYQLGRLKTDQGKYVEAVAYYEKSLKICQKFLPSPNPGAAENYNNSGGMNSKMKEPSEALPDSENILKISQKPLPDLVTFCNNGIGLVYDNTGEYSKAFSSHEKALEMRQKILPRNHPDLGGTYNNIGEAYEKIGEYSKALSSHEKALEIYQKTLSEKHPNLVACYNNIGGLYVKTGEYSRALPHYEKVLEIYQKILPENHPDLAGSYTNIGLVYDKMGEYLKAVSSYEKALEIHEKILPENHPSLAALHNNIGGLYVKVGQYSKALPYYEKVLKICQKILPANHPDLANSYNNIGLVYDTLGEYLKALLSHEKALEMRQQTLPANHSYLAISYNNIGLVYSAMGRYSTALTSHEKALEIRQKTLPPNHPDLASSYNNIGTVYSKMGEYLKALSSHEKAIEIYLKVLPENHPLLATSYNNIGFVYDKMGEYSKALSYCEKDLEICQKSVLANHPELGYSYNNIGCVHESLRDYSKAISFLSRGLHIVQRSLPDNHPNLLGFRKNIEYVRKKL